VIANTGVTWDTRPHQRCLARKRSASLANVGTSSSRREAEDPMGGLTQREVYNGEPSFVGVLPISLHVV
jgi:hypothetical protein